MFFWVSQTLKQTNFWKRQKPFQVGMHFHPSILIKNNSESPKQPFYEQEEYLFNKYKWQYEAHNLFKNDKRFVKLTSKELVIDSNSINFVKLLGQGVSGSVYLAEKTIGQSKMEVAVKIMKVSQQKDWETELETLM